MEQLIVRIKFGSHLYGTDTPASDEDYKSVYVPSARDILLQSVVGSRELGKARKQNGEKNKPGDVDNECYSFQRYLKLVSEGQTVAIDMLFAPEPLMTSPLWEHLQTPYSKGKLLTKKSAAFVGYCRTQANKYGIKGSRVAAAKAAVERFQNYLDQYGPTTKVAEMFVPIATQFDSYTQIVSKETPQGKEQWYFECCNRMVGFNNTLKEALSIFKRIHESYGERARLAETNEGVDWKALSHAVRVGHEAIELLETHKITFPLPNANHIRDIKLGKFGYKEVAEEIERLLVDVEKASMTSTLQESPDQQFIDDLVYSVYGHEVSKVFSAR